MGTRSFIDTNVLIYAEASDLPEKQRVALTVLKQLFEEACGVISTQVLQEYCNIALKKLKLPASHVRAQLELFEQFEVVQVTPAIIHTGLDLQQTRSLAFYDAIIVAVAHRQFRDMGANAIRTFGNLAHVLFDMKYLFPVHASDLRL